MIPILYESNETEFKSNGLGRLRSCKSCIVTEERNGEYTCSFEYPVNAEGFDEIRAGRIIGVTHDETGDVQPFDIVGHEKPIDGIVTFHAQHISYRQSKITVGWRNIWTFIQTRINSLEEAFDFLGQSVPPNPFTYISDKASTGFLSCVDGVPKSARSVLGGIQGSILDTYGGEYEWDKFNVILHNSRGTDRDVSIRYGLNMSNYDDELDTSGTYMACVPYWTDGTLTVIGRVQNADGETITNRGECIPLDVSDKFENQPTPEEVEAMGKSVMESQNPTVPAQTIHVEFVRLQDLGYEEYSDLLKCGLCDTVEVVFPAYGTSGRFKIVRIEWNALAERYESMELGDLSVSLAEALGISESQTGRSSLFKITTLAIETGSISADSYKSGESYAMTAEDGYTAVGIVGWSTTNWRIQPTSHYVVSNTELFSGFANYKAPPASGTVPTASATITFRILWIKQGD